MSDTISSLAQKLRPYWLRDATGGGIVGGGGAMSAHALNGPYHTGELDESQAPWAITDSEFATHVADPDAHHARSHLLANASGLGPDHTISGAVAGFVLKATAANAARMARLMVPELGATGANWDVAALTATNTVGLRTPSSDVRTAPYEALLKSGVVGELALNYLAVGGAMTLNGNGNTANIPDIQFTGNALLAVENSLYLALDSDNSGTGTAFIIGHNSAVTPLSELFRFDDSGQLRFTATAPTISTAANDLTIDPASRTLFADDKQIRSQTHTAGFLGAGFSLSWPLSGKAHLDIRSIYAEELEVTAFQADIMRVRVAEDFLTQSMGFTSRPFTTPSGIGGAVHVYFENNPAFVGELFIPGEWVMFQIIERGTGLLVDRIWGQVTNHFNTGLDGEQRWTFTLQEGPTNQLVNKSTLTLCFGVSGDGYIHHSVLRSMNGPWTRYATWSGANPYTPANRRVHAQAGNLNGLVDITTDRYGIAAGNNLGLTPTTGFSGFLADDTAGLRLFNTAIRIYNGSVNTGLWDSDGQFHIGFNGISTANERDFTITTNALRIGRRLTNYPNLLYNQAVGYLAFCSGTVDKIRFDDNGDSYFAGVMTIGTSGEIRQGTGTLGSNYTGLRIWRDGNIGRIAGYSSNVVQWSADTLGRLTAGGGNILLAANGMRIAPGAFGWSDADSPIDVVWGTTSVRYGSIGGGEMDVLGNAGGVQISGYGLVSQPGIVRLSSFNAAGTLISSAALQGSTFTAENLSASQNVSATATVTGNQLASTNGQIRSNNAFQLLTSTGTAQQVRAGSLLASDTYSHSSRVPANGIYSLGAVAIGVTALVAGVMLDVGGQSYMRGAMTLDGAQYLKALAAAPAAVTGYLPFYFDNATQTLRARLPGGQIKVLTWANA